MSRIAVMGSAFNPPTLGHKDVIEQALKQCDQVWLVPAFRHAWGKKMAPYPVRCQMVELFTQDLADPRVTLHALEHEIAGEKPVYSFDVLAALQSQIQPDDQLFLVIGPDNAASFDKFYRADDIRRRWQLLVVKERISVRSTKLRAALKQHKPITGMTTSCVASFLSTHPVYSEHTS
ncbi:nicotinate-nicotinamide nucleotide adenylyltransferase [Tolumonas lignilytica]|uniref:nicotinate-nicotinamide nucleotide adenylyltransferase n=1 Tax=Tolumonas lignilytica TaxID=1283284 RepID=UPI000465A33C|nr:nicotinate-nicotinamide nucleotide adenylyltransferase [Tolumonas lignilytica]